MPQTPREIAARLNGEPGNHGIWTPVDGVQALTTVGRSISGPPTPGVKQTFGVNFQIGSGLLVKAFINSDTGELRFFPAKLFGYPEAEIG